MSKSLAAMVILLQNGVLTDNQLMDNFHIQRVLLRILMEMCMWLIGVITASKSLEQMYSLLQHGVPLALGNEQLSGPNGVATDSAGNVYVADTGNDRIQKFRSNGTFITNWGGYGSGNAQFNNPLYVAVDHTGNVYVVDHGNNRIQKFSSNGYLYHKLGWLWFR